MKPTWTPDPNDPMDLGPAEDNCCLRPAGYPQQNDLWVRLEDRGDRLVILDGDGREHGPQDLPAGWLIVRAWLHESQPHAERLALRDRLRAEGYTVHLGWTDDPP
jgi:hypothetical protein